MSNIKGKLTLQDKAAASELPVMSQMESAQDFFHIPADLKKEIADKNLAARWINAKKLMDNYGFDSRQWQPYKREKTSKVEISGTFGGTDSEGYIRRGDLILAVRPMNIHAANKQRIANKSKGLQRQSQKGAAEELKQHFEQNQMKGAKVYDGYEDNE